jgi:hypothetical protein
VDNQALTEKAFEYHDKMGEGLPILLFNTVDSETAKKLYDLIDGAIDSGFHIIYSDIIKITGTPPDALI